MAIPKLEDVKIAIVGLGYVGFPLALAFGKAGKFPVIGYDRNAQRIADLAQGIDKNGEHTKEEITGARITYSADPAVLREANFFIIAVPTPVTDANDPDLSPVVGAAEVIGRHLRTGSVVVLESTVYPGVTEDVMAPVIDRVSGLHHGVDWASGYSPERINPGDTEHTIDRIVKVVSGFDAPTLDLVASVYGTVTAGVHRAQNIKTAEAAKVIENIQRDLNIALMNELSLIFERIGIRTRDVLAAAGTKWNFHKYQPGLVGGHCIGVDPYYLTHRAQELGYTPEVILAGRRINDWMPEHVADLMITGLAEAGKVIRGARVLVLGLTFKENIRDTRNSRIHGTIKKLQSYGVGVIGYDPNLTSDEIASFGIESVGDLSACATVDGIVLATLHRQFAALALSDMIRICGTTPGVLVDVKAHFLDAIRATTPPLPLIYQCL